MKLCRKCQIFYQEQIMTCRDCRSVLPEVTLSEALEFTRRQSFSKRIDAQKKNDLADPEIRYYIRRYLKNCSLFLDYDLHKNELRRGKTPKRFFISPLNFTCLINFPWLFFNVLSTNMFHMQYTGYCETCNCKIIPGRHDRNECDYLIDYFSIIDDIINGKIIDRKEIYESLSKDSRAKNLPNAYDDLFRRSARWEAFFDFLSVGLTVAFWLYIAVNISWPMLQVLLQKLAQSDAYELGL